MKDTKRYRKSLGLLELVSLGLGGTIGSGIFIVPGIVAGIAGPSSIIAWLFASISASCVMYSLERPHTDIHLLGLSTQSFQKYLTKRLLCHLYFCI